MSCLRESSPLLAVLPALLACLVLSLPAWSRTAPPDDDAERMAWWREARFGMFIHWGLYAIPAGEWNGQNWHGEWIMNTAHIPVDEYEQFVDRFNPVKFDADEWVRIAKEAGMKYIVITSKHHDGFCLFDSRYTDYDIMSTPFKRDIMRELADACRREGLRICWYHSIMDWHHPDYLPRRGWEDRPADDADFDRYCEYLFNQVEELLTHYGEIGVMWFDGQWEGTWTHERGLPLYEHCRTLQPSVIINNRVDKGRGGVAGALTDRHYAGDFGTPEQEIPPTGLPGVDWETCMTMNHHWGYNRHDDDWKSSRDLIRMLVDIASKGGNYLLNVGPTADGLIPAESVRRLRDMGRWMKINGESIYGTSASPFDDLGWGRCTTRAGEETTTLYLHVFDWPTEGTLVVPGIGNDPAGARLLANPARSLSVTRHDSDLRVQLPGKAPDQVCSVVALDVVGNPIIYRPPAIEADTSILVRPINVRLAVPGDAMEIRYTLDGSDPDADSPSYTRPLTVDRTTIVKARCFFGGRPVSAVTEALFTRVEPLPAVPITHIEAGLICRRYTGNWDALPKFAQIEPDALRIVPDFDLQAGPTDEYFGRRFEGYITIAHDDAYIFALNSDDGARLFIDDRLVIDNDGLHGALEKRGVIALAAGTHAIAVEYFNKTGSALLEVSCAPAGRPPQPIPAGILHHSP
jgi:alpha-L-fucosidase